MSARPPAARLDSTTRRARQGDSHGHEAAHTADPSDAEPLPSLWAGHHSGDEGAGQGASAMGSGVIPPGDRRSGPALPDGGRPRPSAAQPTDALRQPRRPAEQGGASRLETDQRFWDEPPAACLRRLDASPAGLSAAEARARLARWGPNQPRGERRVAALVQLLELLLNPLVVILLVAGAVSATLGEAVDAGLIALIVL